jgi:hypothetical protein
MVGEDDDDLGGFRQEDDGEELNHGLHAKQLGRGTKSPAAPNLAVVSNTDRGRGGGAAAALAAASSMGRTRDGRAGVEHGRRQSGGGIAEEEAGAAAPAQRRSQGTGGGGMRRVVREERGR